MRVLVIGSGAREHALCASLRASPSVDAVLCAPGNQASRAMRRSTRGGHEHVDGLTALATRERVDLVVVGPEGPLVTGIADRLSDAGDAVLRPRRSRSPPRRIEGVLQGLHGAPRDPHGGLRALRLDFEAAAAYVRAANHRVVVKADGLAAGKGVVVCDTVDDADRRARPDRAPKARLRRRGSATVVVEERLSGPEISLHVVADGERFVVLGAAQDHKRLRDGDEGPNTGGMGAYSPVPVFTTALVSRGSAQRWSSPRCAASCAKARPFRGVLFVGLMVEESGTPKVLEYNVRFGDPECAVLLARLDGDLAADCSTPRREVALDDDAVRVRDDASIGVVIAAEGYPDAPRDGRHDSRRRARRRRWRTPMCITPAPGASTANG